MKITIRCFNGEDFDINVSSDEKTIADLKVLIEEQKNIAYLDQKLIFKGKVLKCIKSLNSYGKLKIKKRNKGQ
jgi:hypothetical protein